MHLPARSRPAVVIAACAALLVTALTTSALTATAAHADEVQHIENGTFDSTAAPWWGTANAPVSVTEGRLCAQVAGGTTNPWDASIGHTGIPLVSKAAYKLRFTASASAPVTVKANVQLNEAPYTAALSRDVALTTEPKTFTYDFPGTLDSSNGVLTFQVGGAAAAFTFCIDDVSLISSSDAGPGPDPGEGAEQLTNGDFAQDTLAWISYGAPIAVTDGRLCATVPGGTANPWDAGVGQNNLLLEEGAKYSLSFTGSATPPTSVGVVVQLGQAPYTTAFNQSVALETAGATHRLTFTSPISTSNGQLMFQVGGSAADYRFCIDDVSLRGGTAKPPYTPDTGPRVRVNQVGYLPHGPKQATIVTEATAALPWQLENAEGDVVARGTTTPRGLDEASGQKVHTADFSSVTRVGKGYKLTADGQTSHPFDISGTVYDQLRSDALHFFYLQRSGIEITSELGGQKYARPAGHLGVEPNKGDTDVPCQAGVCNYRLDVRNGWYDAGDHGKYVVNGGIAAYQVLSTFERTKTALTARQGEALADGSLRVPERGNKVPDVLDEARWEVDFMLRMQVPAGKPLAGMAHHKVHDAAWTGLPMLPHNDPQVRELHPVSTAATLNLAAVGAQCARLFAPYDAAFAARCLSAARTAYTAAKANPKRYADPNDGTGGGAYPDEDVTDEFYWAAAELYLTTGDAAYWQDVKASPHHTAEVFATGGYYWGSTAALGRLDLATVPSAISATELRTVRASVTAAADKYLAAVTAEAYGVPFPGESKNYVWGSTSSVVNNAIVLGTAFDLTGEVKYRDGAVQAMDFIFGRNGLNHSYVTGWGEKSSQNQHSRLFSHQLDPDMPNPPAGSLAGGPNVELQDPYAKVLLSGCKPMFCYVDHIDSWSTNEVAVNWNSALAWMASFLADQGTGQKPAPGGCKVTYLNHGSWGAGNGFTGQVVIKNTGKTTIDGWTLRFAFTGDQKLRETWTARVTQAGATVTAKNEFYNDRIQPGGEVTFGFTAKTEGGANPTPGLFTLNGAACS